ncbi:MAG: T9SS type A sorting domain-containing protein [Sphingobacteriaceae bacterium]|nr:T9SS type A sorting domain-containing protein [Sphingobacteriaceae bacterium]
MHYSVTSSYWNEEYLYNSNFHLIYPNPSSNILNLKITDGKSIESYSIMDILGRKVLEQKENSTQINIEGLNKGIYQLITSEGKSYTSKFIKE